MDDDSEEERKHEHEDFQIEKQLDIAWFEKNDMHYLF